MPEVLGWFWCLAPAQLHDGQFGVLLPSSMSAVSRQLGLALVPPDQLVPMAWCTKPMTHGRIAAQAAGEGEVAGGLGRADAGCVTASSVDVHRRL